MGAPEGRRGRGWRVLRRVGLVLLAVVSLVVGVLFTGVPQERAIEYFASNALGAIVEVAYGHALPWLHLERVAVYATEADREAGEPLLDITDLEVEYSLLPSDGRYLRKIDVYSIDVFADARDGREPNYAFLVASDDASQATPDPRVLPVEMNCSQVNTAFRSEGWNFDVSSVPLDVRFDADGNVSALSATEAADIRWWQTDREGVVDWKQVWVQATVTTTDDGISWDQRLSASGFDIFTTGYLETGAEPSVLTGSAGFGAGHRFVQEFARRFDSPLVASSVSGSIVSGSLTFGETPSYEGVADIRIDTPGIRGGDTIYEGLIATDVTLSGDLDELESQALVRLAQGQTVDIALRMNDTDGSAQIATGEWTKAELLDAIPVSFRESVAPLGFEAFSAEARGEWTADEFTVSVRGDSAGEASQAPAISWALDASGPLDGTRPVEGHLESRLGGSLIQAAGHYDESGAYSGEAIVEEVEIRPWLAFFMGPDNAASVSGTIEGTLSARAADLDAPMTITPKFTLREAGYDEVHLDEVTLDGELVYDRTGEAVEIASLRAETVDGLTSVALTDWRYGIADGTGRGAFQAGADLGLVSELFDLPEVYGAATVDGKVTGDGELWRADLTVFSDFVGYGELLFTLGGNVTGGGSVTFDPESGGVRIGELTLSVGEGTTARLQRVQLATSPLSAEGELIVNSDFRLLIDMEYLQEVDGSLRERTRFRYDDAGVSFDWDIESEVNRLVLAEEAGAAEGLSLSGSGTYREGLDGSGELRATLLSAAGGSIQNVLGPATFRGTQMRIEQATGTIFDGLIVADLDIGLLETGLPIFLRSEFSDIDLRALTEEVQPPNTRLTGIANGTLSAEVKSGEVVGFELDAHSDRDLSVNRSLVADLLSSEGFVAGLGERLADRTMDRILGEAPQRPFDSGRLYMYLAEDKLSGTAELRSTQTGAYRGLNLNVSLDVDAKSLQDALLLLEQARLESMEL